MSSSGRHGPLGGGLHDIRFSSHDLKERAESGGLEAKGPNVSGSHPRRKSDAMLCVMRPPQRPRGSALLDSRPSHHL